MSPSVVMYKLSLNGFVFDYENGSDIVIEIFPAPLYKVFLYKIFCEKAGDAFFFSKPKCDFSIPVT